MAAFKLSEDNINRLRAKFDEFQREREKMHRLIIDYLADYRQFQGSVTERRDFMSEKYSGRAVSMSHLVYNDNLNEFYWQTFEIQLLLGRDQSTISRTILNMEKSELWRTQLLALRKQSKSPNGNKIYVYKQGIFDLILDHYEEEYLLRFAEPRRGDKDKAPDINELRRFWNYLKETVRPEADLKIKSQDSDIIELADIPPLSLKEIIALIWRKAFSAQTMTLTSVFIALGFFITHYFSSAALILFITACLTFAACIVLIRMRVMRVEFLFDAGAAAMLFMMSWGAYMLSQNYYYKPDNFLYNNLSLQPELSIDRNLIFRINANSYNNIKEIFYKISPDKNFTSTGFNDLNYPYLIIEPEKNKNYDDFIEIALKYIDVDGKEYGTWNFVFDVKSERLKLSKNFFINYFGEWLHKFYSPDKIIVAAHDFNSEYADNIVKAVAYGINTDTPDKILILNNDNTHRNKNIILNTNKNKSHDYKYISSYLIFSDGTSSDAVQRLDL
ncbi:MAG: hypothetical protein IJ667_07760 [Synergistaceae bacterium]|nr:hypothetical protein [Synergistaceae bacterium]